MQGNKKYPLSSPSFLDVSEPETNSALAGTFSLWSKQPPNYQIMSLTLLLRRKSADSRAHYLCVGNPEN